MNYWLVKSEPETYSWNDLVRDKKTGWDGVRNYQARNHIRTMKKGDRVSLVGFGTFSVAKRAARAGRNPQTGKTIQIKAKKVAKFKAGSDLAKTVNK